MAERLALNLVNEALDLYAVQGGTLLEHAVTHRLHVAGNDNTLQVGAVLEGVVLNLFQRRGQFDAFQTLAVLESVILYLLDAA